MQISVGFRLTLQCESETPLVLALSPHPDEEHRLAGAHPIRTAPDLPLDLYIDEFGNTRTRMTAPKGAVTIWSDCVAEDNGLPDEVDWSAKEHRIQELPSKTLRFLSSSRYCETDLLSEEAWQLFGNTAPGWARVQAICDYVHENVTFGYQYARATKTALCALREGNGVCRDFAHLAITFCRAMNIPARYVSGYLGDIGIPPAGPGDFCGWFEAYLGGRWYTFDARYNVPRIGRIVIARGRDAADVAMITSFGLNNLVSFEVWAEEILRPAPFPRPRSDRPLPAAVNQSLWSPPRPNARV